MAAFINSLPFDSVPLTYDKSSEMAAIISGENSAPAESAPAVTPNPDQGAQQPGQPQFPPPGSPPADDLFNQGVYLRGALTLHALRLQVGDEAFFNILRAYAERYQYKNATTADFIALAEEISGQDLGDFFDAWLYATEMPPIPQMGLGAAG
jgi:hypothetical protein